MLVLIAIVTSLAALFGLVSTKWLRLPIVVGTMLLTVISSVLLMLTSHLNGSVLHMLVHTVQQLHYENFILHGMLSLLLFAGAFLFDIEALAQQKLAVSMLAVFSTIISTALVGAGIYYVAPLLGVSVPLVQALLFGALISPTDPIAVLEMLRRVSAPTYLQAQLAGESLFNDGVGAVLFLAALGVAEKGVLPTISHLGLHLVVAGGGGLLLGILLAWPIARMMRAVEAYQIDLLLTLSLALGGYALAEALHVSAPLEAVAAGLALRWQNRIDSRNIAEQEIEQFWRALDEVQNSILFVLIGLESAVVAFRSTTFALGAVAVVLVNAVRFTAVAAVLYPLRWLRPSLRTSVPVLAWAGLRGGLSIALALSVPAELGREWILATAYIVVTFSIIVKGATMNLFLERFGPKLLEGDV